MFVCVKWRASWLIRQLKSNIIYLAGRIAHITVILIKKYPSSFLGIAKRHKSVSDSSFSDCFVAPGILDLNYNLITRYWQLSVSIGFSSHWATPLLLGPAYLINSVSSGAEFIFKKAKMFAFCFHYFPNILADNIFPHGRQNLVYPA